MDKTELRKAMKQHTGGAEFITATELTTFLGYSKESSKRVKAKFLVGLQSIDKRYFIPEVADRILERRAYS